MHKPQVSSQRSSKILVLCFFIAYFIIGMTVFKDYGANWDSIVESGRGSLSMQYILRGDKALFSYGGRFHGAAFEIFLFEAARILHVPGNTRATFLFRHAMTFLLFYISVFLFYRIAARRFQSQKFGLVGSLFLIASPHIFAHSFYNTKDIVFLSLFITSIYTLVKYLENKSVGNALLHALACALLIDVRVLGIFAVALTFIFWYIDLLFSLRNIPDEKTCARKIVTSLFFASFLLIYFGFIPKCWNFIASYPLKAPLLFLGFTLLILNLFAHVMREAEIRKMNVSLQCFIATLACAIVAFWPFLWPNPLLNLIDAFIYMKHYPWNTTVLYMGYYIKAAELPWHYIPVWILITTPIVYSLFFILGCLTAVKSLAFRTKDFFISRRYDLLYMVWLFLPLVYVIMARSVLYDSWRHLFFIYPAFIMIALMGIKSAWQFAYDKLQGRARIIIHALIALIIAGGAGKTILFMAANHPYQNVYFNLLAGRNMEEVKNNFELDYWGISYKQALEYILKTDPREKIKISVPKFTLLILPENDKKRVILVKAPKEADYFITNFRWLNKGLAYQNEYYAIKVGGTKILVAYKMDEMR